MQLFQPTSVFNVGGRHEVISMYHHDNSTFLIFHESLGIRSCKKSRCSMSAGFLLRTPCRTSKPKEILTFLRSRAFCPLRQAPQTLAMCWGSLRCACATSVAMSFLTCSFLDVPVAALLTMYLSISKGEVDEKKSGSLHLLNPFATDRKQYLGFASSCLFVSIHLTWIGIFPVTSMHFWAGTFLYCGGHRGWSLGFVSEFFVASRSHCATHQVAVIHHRVSLLVLSCCSCCYVFRLVHIS